MKRSISSRAPSLETAMMPSSPFSLLVFWALLLATSLDVVEGVQQQLRGGTTDAVDGEPAMNLEGETRQPQRRLVDDMFRELKDDQLVHAFVKFNDPDGRKRIQKMPSYTLDEDFSDEIQTMSITMTKQELRTMENDVSIGYIERSDEPVVHLLGHENEVVKDEPAAQRDLQEKIPYGIKMIDGIGVPRKKAPTGACKNPNAFKLAIVDSGIAGGHPDLRCSRTSPGCIGKSFVTGAGPWYTDSVSHGTKVAGIINAQGGNRKGLRGVISDKQVCLIIAKCFGESSNANMNTILQAVKWSVSKGAKVINLSLGTNTNSPTASAYYEYLFRKRNKLVVAAAGNDGTYQYMYPSAYPGVIGVSAIDMNENIASFSNRNDRVDFSAAGVSVFSTSPGNAYGVSSGTSVAAPFVSAAFASVWRNCAKKCRNNQVLKCFRDTAKQKGQVGSNGKNVYYGNGIIQTRKAYFCLKRTCCK